MIDSLKGFVKDEYDKYKGLVEDEYQRSVWETVCEDGRDNRSPTCLT